MRNSRHSGTPRIYFSQLKSFTHLLIFGPYQAILRLLRTDWGRRRFSQRVSSIFFVFLLHGESLPRKRIFFMVPVIEGRTFFTPVNRITGTDQAAHRWYMFTPANTLVSLPWVINYCSGRWDSICICFGRFYYF